MPAPPTAAPAPTTSRTPAAAWHGDGESRGGPAAVPPAARLFPPASKPPRGPYRLKPWLSGRLPVCVPRPRPDGGFGVLMYHRVTDPVPGLPRPTWNVPPALFRAQLAGLLGRGFRPVRISEMLDRAARSPGAGGHAPPDRAFAVTFDDGYLNNLTRALPVLEELGVPATVFVATAYLDGEGPFPFDDWPAKGDPRVPREAWAGMTTLQCRRLAASPLVELGAHTHTHQDFRGRPELFADDLRENCRQLASRFGVGRPTFAFPYGTAGEGFSGGALEAAARTAPVRCALTTEDVRVRPRDDPFRWGRFTASDADTAATLAAKLDGRFGTVKALWRGLRPRGGCRS